MADQKISALTANPTITGAEMIPIAKGGSNYRETFDNLKTWVLAGGSGWGVTGNAGTTAGTNFIGTTDDIDFVIKRNSLVVARFYTGYRIEAGDSTNMNLFIGIGSGDAVVPNAGALEGIKNTFLGFAAGGANTTGSWNTFLGERAGEDNTTGSQNVYVGHAAGFDNIQGQNNVAVGVNALEFGTNVSSATCVGNAAGRNITGTNPTCIGASAATVATSADETTAVGSGALATLTTGDNNTAIGRGAAPAVTTGSNNTMLGTSAGSAFNTTSSDNIIIGSGAGDGTAGAKNNNILIGSNALGNVAGNNNIAIGQRAGLTWRTNVNVTFANSCYIGSGYSSKDNELVLGGKGFANNVYYNSIYFNGRFNQVANLQAVTLQPNSVTDVNFSTTASANSGFGAAVTDGSAAAATLTIAGAQGTGTGAGGPIIFSTAPAGSTGNTNNALVEAFRIAGSGDLVIARKTINTSAGDSATINSPSGRFRKDTSGTTFTLTNSFITANSIIILTAANAAIDASATSWTVSAGAGSAAIEFNAAPTANFDMNFFITN